MAYSATATNSIDEFSDDNNDEENDSDSDESCSDCGCRLGHGREPFDQLGGDTFSLDIFSKEFSSSAVYRAIVSCSLAYLYHAVYCLSESVTLVDANFGVNFLHVVASTAVEETDEAFEPFVYALSNLWVDANKEDAGGDTPLRLALRRGLPAVARALLRCGAQHTPEEEKAVGEPNRQRLLALLSQFSPGLWAAVAADDYFLVDRLLSYWCRVRISRQGGSLICFARSSGCGSLVVDLLEGSRPTLEFVHATLAGDRRKMLALLKNKNVNADVRDRSGKGEPRSLRQTAVAMRHTHVLHLLPDRVRAGARRQRASSVVCQLM